ncbi:MAG: hypothetical protein MHM6MM_002623 [Cercozoa sp. M6MM]
MIPVLFEVADCPASAPFFGYMGIAAAIVFSNLGSAYGTAKAGVGLSSMGVMAPHMVMRSIIPVIMAGILGIYGLIVGIIINTRIGDEYSGHDGYAHFASGLMTGLSCLAAGLSIGIVGDAGVRAVGQQPSLMVSMIIVLVFGEALALYGLIVGIVVSMKSQACPTIPSPEEVTL